MGRSLLRSKLWAKGASIASGGSGSVTSVGLTMPAAFTVSGSPVTGAGTLAVTGAGTTGQYVRGDGTLASFPTVPTEATITELEEGTFSSTLFAAPDVMRESTYSAGTTVFNSINFW